MLVFANTVAAIGFLLLLVWVLRGTRRRPDVADGVFLHRVDMDAFRNLLSDTNAEYLRSSLSKPNYRRVQKSQLRAVHEYLYWIAEDCAMILAVTRTDLTHPTTEAADIARRAVRLRLIALSYCALIWIRYLVPGESLRPRGVLGNYEELRRGTEAYLVRYRLQPESAG